jgi:cellulose synthase/poly-beta-1,6-N-acetylglucosamine synthase-like glycosyltransferase
MSEIITLIEYTLWVYFIFTTAYALFFAVGGFVVPIKLKRPTSEKLHSICVFIPAYKEDFVILPVAAEALKQNYPNDKYRVVVVADSLKEETLSNLRKLDIEVIEVSFEKSTKVKALQVALNQLNSSFDIAVILDADNVMEPDFLSKINETYSGGYKVIQAQRVAKNMNTSFAILDSLSEKLNNHIYRKGHTALGFSSSLIGSGMAFDYAIFKETILDMDSVGGFDREMEVKLLIKGYKSIYLEKAKVYDEKIDKVENFGKQRTRWISSQFIYLRKYFYKGFASLFKGDLVLFNSTVLRNIHLPRLINLGLLFIITAIHLVFYRYQPTFANVWLVLLLAYLASFVLSVHYTFYDRKFFLALLSVPVAFIEMSKSFLKLRNANKTFIHTPHSHTDVETKKQ